MNVFSIALSSHQLPYKLMWQSGTEGRSLPVEGFLSVAYYCHALLSSDALRDLLQNTTFELAVVDLLYNECSLALAYKHGKWEQCVEQLWKETQFKILPPLPLVTLSAFHYRSLWEKSKQLVVFHKESVWELLMCAVISRVRKNAIEVLLCHKSTKMPLRVLKKLKCN